MVDLEQAFGDVEGVAETARKAASAVAAHAKKLENAAHSGNIAGLKRARTNLGQAVATLGEAAARVAECWPFTDDEEKGYLEERYAELLVRTAADRGLEIHEQDGNLLSYPSVVRVLPSARAVRIDRRRVSAIRPSHLVGLLLKRRSMSGTFAPKSFMESLYRVYTDIVGGAHRQSGGLDLPESGRVVPLAKLYKLMTALPGAARDYGRSDFARDIYLLDSKGPRHTKSGAEVSFPASTGTRSRTRDMFSFIGPEGDRAEYYGIRFSESEG